MKCVFAHEKHGESFRKLYPFTCGDHRKSKYFLKYLIAQGQPQASLKMTSKYRSNAFIWSKIVAFQSKCTRNQEKSHFFRCLLHVKRIDQALWQCILWPEWKLGRKTQKKPSELPWKSFVAIILFVLMRLYVCSLINLFLRIAYAQVHKFCLCNRQQLAGRYHANRQKRLSFHIL